MKRDLVERALSATPAPVIYDWDKEPLPTILVNGNPVNIMRYQFDFVIEALRRDVRAENEASRAGGEWAQWHRDNARRSTSLLDILNPKHTTARSSWLRSNL